MLCGHGDTYSIVFLHGEAIFKVVEAEALASTAVDTTTEWVELLRRHVVEEPWRQ